MISATFGKSEKLILLDPLKIHFQFFFALSFSLLLSNELNAVTYTQIDVNCDFLLIFVQY